MYILHPTLCLSPAMFNEYVFCLIVFVFNSLKELQSLCREIHGIYAALTSFTRTFSGLLTIAMNLPSAYRITGCSSLDSTLAATYNSTESTEKPTYYVL